MPSMDDHEYRSLEGLINLVKTLRGPSGCSWDREQTLESLVPYMLEEAYEVADAVVSGEIGQLKAELGDLLLHVVMSAVICEEAGAFSIYDVIEGISDKLIRRHPHVFGVKARLTPAEVERQWEAIKAEEKGDEGFFGSIPSSMPALQTAWRIQQRASEVGFDWPDAGGAMDKVVEELEELRKALEAGGRDDVEEELGDLLFGIVNYCRLLGFQPEAVLRAGNMKFMKRFSRMEEILREEGYDLAGADLQVMEDAWNRAKED